MGFYFRKSISAGPFRFNLSEAGVGMSVGVKGFRVGTGPRGNYVHMGRGGLYYRASLGGGRRQVRQTQQVPQNYNAIPVGIEQAVPIETGNVFEMLPSNGSELLQQINEKLSLLRVWPWTLCGGLLLSFVLGGQAATANAVLPMLFLTLVLTIISWWWDQSRKAVVVMYDLSDDVAEKFKRFSDEFEAVGQASRMWNIDTAANTSDWKRNAGASRLLTRKSASILDLVPSVVKTNISVPCIKGGKQTLHFFPDIVLIVEGGKAGALSYEQLDILWSTTVFIEGGGVPGDSQVVGHTWRFANKNGGPDRRFKNNAQIPEVLYQQMGLRGGGGLQKILHISKVTDRSRFDAALQGLRAQVRELSAVSKGSQQGGPKLLEYREDGDAQKKDRSPIILSAILFAAVAIAGLLYFYSPNLDPNIEAQPQALAPAVPSPAPTPSPAKAATTTTVDAVLQKQLYRGPGNRGNYETDKMRVVTDFYRALELGDGRAAAAFVVPENAQRGSLSSAALTAKFSVLTEPLNLDNVQQRPNGAVRVRYSYMPTSGLKCVGLAAVTLIEAVPDPLITRIRFNELCR